MGGFNWLAVLVGVASLVMSAHCSVSCSGTDGQPGVAGTPGRDGLRGAKGEKGDPAVNADGQLDPGALLGLKGEVGSPGLQGAMGPKGYRGNLGTAGKPGKPGLPGPNGKNLGHGDQDSHQSSSAFSAVRTESSYPRFKQRITFQNAVVNKGGHFDTGTGEFTCRIPGVYYFSFQVEAKVSVCLNIASEALSNPLGFCDYSKSGDQVFSGGVVLVLTEAQKVWLEPFKEDQTDNDVRDIRAKKITFNGFLLFRGTD